MQAAGAYAIWLKVGDSWILEDPNCCNILQPSVSKLTHHPNMKCPPFRNPSGMYWIYSKNLASQTFGYLSASKFSAMGLGWLGASFCENPQPRCWVSFEGSCLELGPSWPRSPDEVSRSQNGPQPPQRNAMDSGPLPGKPNLVMLVSPTQQSWYLLRTVKIIQVHWIKKS